MLEATNASNESPGASTLPKPLVFATTPLKGSQQLDISGVYCQWADLGVQKVEATDGNPPDMDPSPPSFLQAGPVQKPPFAPASRRPSEEAPVGEIVGVHGPIRTRSIGICR